MDLPDQCKTNAYAPDFYSFCRSNFISVTGAEGRIMEGLPYAFCNTQE